jgi:signal peptidase I
MRRKRRAVTGFGVFMLFVLAFAVFFNRNFRTVEVRGNSMWPTFKSGDRVLVSSAYWLIGPIRKNDIVVIRNKDDTLLLKRVYAMGGDTIPFKFVPEDYSVTNGKYVVPEGKLYLLGDNYPESEDSRHYGPISPEQVIGKVVVYH